MKNKFIIGIAVFFVTLISLGGFYASAQDATQSTLNPFSIISGFIKARSATNGLQIPSLANKSCLGTDSVGKFGTGTCSGGGGGSATTTITAGGVATGPAITIATTTDTNLLLKVVGSGSTLTFTPSFTGTLADPRIASAVTWNGKAASTTSITVNAPLTGGGDLQANRTISLPKASSTADGYLSQTDWSTFNNKGSGSVTSVDMTVPTGLSVSGNPVTSAGTLALALTSGYNIPLTASTTDFNTGYLQRLQWDGGSTNLVAATGRTSLGLVIGTNVQAYNANLTTYAGIAPSANIQTLLGAADYSAFKTSLSLNNVENTALSTWAGTSNITTVGTLTTGTWSATVIAPNKGGTGTTTAPTVQGQVLAADSTGTKYGPANLIAGSNVTITTTTPGQITIAASGSTGLSSFAAMTGPAITVATGSDTNIGLNITTGSNNATFTPIFIGTLADGRITSASTWNAKVGPTRAINTTFPLQGGGDLSADRTLTFATGDLNLTSANLSFTVGDGKKILAGTSTTITLTDNPTFTKIIYTNASGTNESLSGNFYVTGTSTLATTTIAKLTVNGNAISGANSGDVTLAGQNYLTLSGQQITANAVDLSGTNVAGTLAAARMPALTGDITTSAGAVATTLATVNASAGTFGDASHVAQVTVNGKGLSTTVASVSIALAASQITSGQLAVAQGGTGTSTLGNLTLTSSNLSFGSGDGKLILVGTSTNITLATSPSFTNGTFTGTLSVSATSTLATTTATSLTVSALSSGNCVQAGAGGILTTVVGACGTAGGITSLNGLTGASQTFATSTTATGLTQTITSSGTAHTWNLGLTSGYNIPLTASTTDWNAYMVKWGDIQVRNGIQRLGHSFNNFLSNGSMDYWYGGTSVAPSGWATQSGGGTFAIARSATSSVGSYSSQVSFDNTDDQLRQSVPVYTNTKVTLTLFYQKLSGAGNLVNLVAQEDGGSFTEYATTALDATVDGTFRFTMVSFTKPNDGVNAVRFKIASQDGNNSVWLFDEAMMQEGLNVATAFTDNFIDGSSGGQAIYGSKYFYSGANFATNDTTSSGRVGIGTSSPIVLLDVWGNMNVATSSIPLLRLDTSTTKISIGTTTQTEILTIAGNTASYGQYYSNPLSAATTTVATITKTIDFNNGNVQSFTISTSTTLSFTNIKAAGRYLLIIQQDSTGSRLVTWPASVHWPAGTAPTLTTTANKVDIVSLVCYSTTVCFAGSNLNYSP